jgi:hypothetical protein
MKIAVSIKDGHERQMTNTVDPIDIWTMFIGTMKQYIKIPLLVVGLEPWNFMIFHSVGNVIIPTDELIFFRGVGQPPTSR